MYCAKKTDLAMINHKKAHERTESDFHGKSQQSQPSSQFIQRMFGAVKSPERLPLNQWDPIHRPRSAIAGNSFLFTHLGLDHVAIRFLEGPGENSRAATNVLAFPRDMSGKIIDGRKFIAKSTPNSDCARGEIDFSKAVSGCPAINAVYTARSGQRSTPSPSL
jgi:hypothetical protein